MTPDTKTNETSVQPREALDADAALNALRGRRVGLPRYYREATVIAGRELGATAVRIETKDRGQDLNESWTEPGVGTSPDEFLQAAILEHAMDDRIVARVVEDAGQQHLIVALPIPVAVTSPRATLAACILCATRNDAENGLTDARALVELIGKHAPVAGPPARRHSDARDANGTDAGVAAAADYENPVQFGFRLVNGLRARLGATQVFFATVQRKRSRIRAISGQDDARPRNPELRPVRQAMDETIDVVRALVAQEDDNWNEGTMSEGHRLHAQWREAAGGATVASFPLIDKERVVAVIGVRRDRAQPFSRDEFEALADQIASYGPALRLLRRASRSLFVHSLQSTFRLIAWAGSPRSLKIKTSLVLAAALCAWVAFGTLAHTVSAPAVIRAQELRHLSAPFEGRLIDVRVLAGDKVKAGDILAVFDTSDLVLKERELKAEDAALGVEIDRAEGRGERAEARVLRARRTVVTRKLEGLDAEMARASLLAPFDGVVVQGDVKDRRGDVFRIGEPLFEIARGENVRIEVQADERDWRFLKPEQIGEFAPNSHPENGHSLRVERIREATEVIDGRNAFIAEANLDDGDDAQLEALRPGMEGVVRLDAGPRPVWWLASHRAIDWLRLQTWF